MATEFDATEFAKRLREQLKASREGFDGRYKAELEALAGLSREQVDAITPGTTDMKTYDQLITVVKEASRVNLSQAALKGEIMKLGGVAVSIAKMVPQLAAII